MNLFAADAWLFLALVSVYADGKDWDLHHTPVTIADYRQREKKHRVVTMTCGCQKSNTS